MFGVGGVPDWNQNRLSSGMGDFGKTCENAEFPFRKSEFVLYELNEMTFSPKRGVYAKSQHHHELL